MNLTIFGASGRTGRELVRQALARSHHVTAVVRRPDDFAPRHDNLAIFRGDIVNLDDVAAAIDGRHAVVSALGPHTLLRRVAALTAGIRNIVRAMEAVGVGRLVYTSALGVGDSLDDQNAFFRYVLCPVLLGRDYADHLANEEIIKSSALDWTIARPARLTDGPRTGNYEVRERLPATFPLGRISRADVADFLLNELEHPAHLRHTPGLLGFKSLWA